MRVIYIRESEKLSSFWELVLFGIKRFFCLIERKEVSGKVIYYIPIVGKRNIFNFKVKRISSKINKMLDKDESNIVVLSKYLYGISDLKNYLYSNNVDILSGRFLFKCLSYKVIEYVFKCWDIDLELGETTILVNDFTELNKDIIIYIAKRIKRLNIVTNHIDRFKKIEEYLYNEYGIILNISNNKRKSLLKSKLILNFDFPEELVNKYRMYDEAVLVNICEKINISRKRFNGININSYKINMPDEYEVPNFSNELVYESLIYKLNSFKNINERFLMDKISIDKFIGNNGFIEEKYLKKSLNVLTKHM